ncbi:MAG TPA: thiol reductant ABC exporter subunit CydC [Anaerolineaceae bacterium]
MTAVERSASAPQPSGALRLLLGFLRPFVGEVALSVLLGVATVASGVSLLGTSAFLIASAALHPSVAALEVAIVGVRFFGISRAVFRYLERLVSHSANLRLLAGLRSWFYRRLEPLAPARLQAMGSADLLSRAIADIDTLENFYVRVVAPPLVALIVTAAVGVFAGQFDVRLALLLVLLLGVAEAGLPWLTHNLARKPGRAVVERRSELNTHLLDLIQGMPDLITYGQDGAQLNRIQSAGCVLAEAQRRVGQVGALGNALNLLLSGLALWGVLYLAIPLVGQRIDGISLAVLALVSVAAFEAVAPLTQAAQHLESTLQAARHLQAMVQVAPEVALPAEPTALMQESFDLQFHNLTFAYSAGEMTALDGFNLELPQGKKVALVGASGAGKTTLLNLLLRFWEVQQGEIVLNGRDIRVYDPEAVRARIALVAQSTYLFAGTLRQNLLLADPGASEANIQQIVDQAQLTGLVANLLEGLDTWVGERGILLSGGERQRVAVARALLRDASLLLLDEPTANLDAVSEQQILAMLRQASAGRSVIAVTHRLTRMDDWDEILVLREGRVIERGTHAALLAACGEYAQMWQIQREMLE